MADSQTPSSPAESCESQVLHRSQVSLPPIMSISYEEWNKPYDINDTIYFEFEDDDEVQAVPPHLAPRPTPSQVEESHLMQVLDGLYIAVVTDEDHPPALRTFYNEPFTHVVQIAYQTTYSNLNPNWLNWATIEQPRCGPVHHLDLFCPTIYRKLSPNQTAIGLAQLHAAREFLSLALPHGADGWWPEELRAELGMEREEPLECPPIDKQDGSEDNEVESPTDEQGDEDEKDPGSLPIDGQDNDKTNRVRVLPLPRDSSPFYLFAPRDQPADKVNVLIVAPADRAVDVLAVLLCYMSFLGDSKPDDIDISDCCDEVWNNAKEAMERMTKTYVEMVANTEYSHSP